VDTNSDPTGINFPIHGNDDARRAINLYCDLIKQTILDAQQNMSKTEGEDLKIEKKKETPKIETNNEKPNKNDKIKTVKKISKSILSKVKSLTSKKKN